MKSATAGRNRPWVLPGLLVITIFFASGESEIATPGIVNFDKVGHALVFGLLATLVARTQPRRRFWVGALAASGYGLLDEFRQSFTPGRSVEVADWLADTFGAALAVALYTWWTPYRRFLEWRVGGSREPQVAFRRAPVRHTDQ